MVKKYDWEQIERFFLDAGYDSRLSLKETAYLFSIPYQSVRRYAAAHKWHSRRFRLKIESENGMSYKEFLDKLQEEVMNRKYRCSPCETCVRKRKLSDATKPKKN